MGIKFLDESASAPEPSNKPSIRFLDTEIGKAAASAVDKLTPDISTIRNATKQLDTVTSVPMRGLKGAAVTGANLISGEALQPSLERGEQAVKPDFTPKGLGEQLASFAAELADPRAMPFAGLKATKAAAAISRKPGILATEASKLGEVLTGVDERNFIKIAQDPLSILKAKSSEETGKLFAAAKKAVGVTDVEERIIALSEGARKRTYRQVLEKIDKGVEPTVAELLQAKKAGDMIAQSDAAAKGLIGKEIAEKVNPLLKKIAPKVYEAQQAVHLSKVKEAFMQVFPRTAKGDIAYLRMVGSGVSSIISPYVAALFSPVVSGGITATAGLAAKAANSPVGRQVITSQALKGFGLKDQNNNQSELDKLNQRLKNAK